MKVLFRAKEKNLDNYVTGYEYYNHIEDEYYITHYITGQNYKIDRSTRSINLPDMLDSQGNKIFAALSEDGKGGDRLEAFNKIFIAKYSKEDGSFLVVSSSGSGLFSKNYLKINFKVIGIQQ